MRKNYFFDFIMIALILMIAIKIMFPDILTTKIIVQVTSPDVIVESSTISDLSDTTVDSDDVIVETQTNENIVISSESVFSSESENILVSD